MTEPDRDSPGPSASTERGGWRRRGRQGPLRLALLAVVVLAILWLARGIIGPFVVAAVLAYAFSPLVSAAERRTHLPRVAIIGVGYVIALVGLGIVVAIVAGRASSELRELSAAGGTDVIHAALRRLVNADQLSIAGREIAVTTLAGELQSALLGSFSSPTDAIHYASAAVDVALQVVLTLIVMFYFLLDADRFAAYVLRFLDRRRRVRTVQIAGRIHEVLGRWLRGQLLLIGLVAVVLYLILGPILHVPYALALGILSGILEIIPLVGPLIAAGLAVTVAFGHGGPGLAVLVAVVYLVVREVEDQLVMPVVIGRAVHLHPVVTIFAVLVGLSVWGILGGLLGVPVAAALNVTLHELYPEETGETNDDASPGGRPAPAAARPEQAG